MQAKVFPPVMLHITLGGLLLAACCIPVVHVTPGLLNAITREGVPLLTRRTALAASMQCKADMTMENIGLFRSY